jgi:hypothetical protein
LTSRVRNFIRNLREKILIKISFKIKYKIRGVWPLLVLHISEIARATANLLEDSGIYKTYTKLPKYSTDKKT